MRRQPRSVGVRLILIVSVALGRRNAAAHSPVLLRISWPTTVAVAVFQLLRVVNICCAPVRCSVLGVSPVLCSVLGNAKTMEKS